MAKQSVVQSPTLVTSLLCEGVRKEITGQDLIYGIFDEAINLQFVPMVLNVCVYARFRFYKSDSVKLGLRAMQDGRHILPQAILPLQQPQIGSLMTVVIGPMSLAIQSFGNIRFEYSFDTLKWEELVRATIRPLQPAVPVRSEA